MPRYKPWKGVGTPKQQYPLLNPPLDAVYELEPYSPRCGRFYRVVDNETQVVLHGYLDHVAKSKAGDIVGYLFSPIGELLDSKPITGHVAWYRLREV